MKFIYPSPERKNMSSREVKLTSAESHKRSGNRVQWLDEATQMIEPKDKAGGKLRDGKKSRGQSVHCQKRNPGSENPGRERG